MGFVLVLNPSRDELFLEPSTTVLNSVRKAVELDKYRKVTTVVSIDDVWRGRPDHEELYLVGDRCHPSSSGHAAIAAVLAELPVFRLRGELTAGDPGESP